jgi:hypothetical protein
MNNLPQKTLSHIIDKYGFSIWDDPRRCEGLLRDLCSEYRLEVNLLISALKEQVPATLLASKGATPWGVLQNLLTKRLHENLGITEEGALWAVQSWALALRVISSDEIPQPNSVEIAQPCVIPQSNSLEQSEKTDPSEEIKLALAKASRCIKPAWVTGYFLGGMLLIFFLTNPRNPTGLFLGLIILGLSYGIYRKNKVCAVISFTLSVMFTILIIIATIKKPQTGIMIFLLLNILCSYFLYLGIKWIYKLYKLLI